MKKNNIQGRTAQPLVSVLLPTLNGYETIQVVLSSVLHQRYVNFEIIIIDDGSDLKTKKLLTRISLRDRRIRLISNRSNLGIAKSLNKGIALARGKYIARIDDDDVWMHKDKLYRQVAFLEQNRDYVLVGTGGISTPGNATYKIEYSDERIRATILARDPFIHSSVLFRKRKFRYPLTYPHNEDWALWISMLRNYKAHNISEQLVSIRRHERSIMHTYLLSQIYHGFRLVMNNRDSFPHGNVQVMRYVINSVMRIGRGLSLFLRRVL